MRYDSEAIGTNIRAIRRARNMTLKDLSKKTGVTEAHLSKIETGKSTTLFSTVAKICEELDCSMEQLAGNEPFVMNGGE